MRLRLTLGKQMADTRAIASSPNVKCAVVEDEAVRVTENRNKVGRKLAQYLGGHSAVHRG